jgi:hypothetical protein
VLVICDGQGSVPARKLGGVKPSRLARTPAARRVADATPADANPRVLGTGRFLHRGKQ